MVFYIISKLFWTVAEPGNLLAFCCAGGLVLLAFTPYRRAGVVLAVSGIVGLSGALALPLGNWMLGPLENRFVTPRELKSVDGIVVLGGAIDPAVTAARGLIALNDASERLTETASLARRFPAAKIVVSGGSTLLNSGVAEAWGMRSFLMEQGVDPSRIIVEDKSRNTAENAQYSRQAVKAAHGETWLVVTSAFHMARAIGCFRQVGWQVVAYPVDFRTPRSSNYSLVDQLAPVNIAAKEWIGLLVYWLSGRIPSVFPGGNTEEMLTSEPSDN